MALLELHSLTVRYRSIVAVRDVDLEVDEGAVVGLIGPNGAGKTTSLGAIAGLLKPTAGAVVFDGVDVTGHAPDALLRRGLALVPEHRRIFADLSVADNLRVGGATVPASRRAELLEEMVHRFPVLATKWSTPGGYLSGGEAQQLAIGRALMSEPRLILMDEPSLGLAPSLVTMVFELIDELRHQGRTLLVVEQNATRMLEVADGAAIMRSGAVVASGPAQSFRDDPDLFASFIGGPTTVTQNDHDPRTTMTPEQP